MQAGRLAVPVQGLLACCSSLCCRRSSAPQKEIQHRNKETVKTPTRPNADLFSEASGTKTLKV